MSIQSILAVGLGNTAVADDLSALSDIELANLCLPINRDDIASKRLAGIIDHLEAHDAPGSCTVWSAMVKAGVQAHSVVYRDVDDDFAMFNAALEFRIRSEKIDGFMRIEDDPTERCYTITVQHNGQIERDVIRSYIRDRNFAKVLLGVIELGTLRADQPVHTRH
ncbi:hypothetical protein [Paraburkholderia fungorum]|uniref:Phage tail protein n=1 Tax=Paraburkholderia fungorum TaxID=134537 RepID=A0AAW3V0U5_9BURK|nr:hypothetical protein [Paraburkholderia fungorum]MBB4517380.1 hypothetical protein [Paraburkholderia fungorum]MBB6204448.1 hypothetical protein [Paraburkholderia fungorum]